MISCCCWRRDCSKKRMNEAGQTAWWEQPLVPRQLFATLVLEAEDPLLISQEPDGNNAREGRRNQGPAVSSCQWGWGIVIVMWWCQCVLISTQPTHKQETRYLCQSPDPVMRMCWRGEDRMEVAALLRLALVCWLHLALGHNYLSDKVTTIGLLLWKHNIHGSVKVIPTRYTYLSLQIGPSWFRYLDILSYGKICTFKMKWSCKSILFEFEFLFLLCEYAIRKIIFQKISIRLVLSNFALYFPQQHFQTCIWSQAEENINKLYILNALLMPATSKIMFFIQN